MAAVGLETLCAGRDPLAQLKALRQPAWSPPTWLWVLIGLCWYGICFAGLWRLLAAEPVPVGLAVLLVALMVLNAAANIPLFRMGRLDLALAFFGFYWPVLALFLWLVRGEDAVTFALFAAYSVYQLYAVIWAFALWRMNRTVVDRADRPPLA